MCLVVSGFLKVFNFLRVCDCLKVFGCLEVFCGYFKFAASVSFLVIDPWFSEWGCVAISDCFPWGSCFVSEQGLAEWEDFVEYSGSLN